ncbi:MAG TPA: phosphatidylglycerol lysyltransferase domain-containing protein [Solirubrobacteraceae bacterium]|nr:phosphatidylglycerol lysyltransferase domain-containing protein [Solirubrobacteraceae bacterium]
MDSSRTSPWLPRLAAFAAAFVGLVNIGSALTPNIRWRGHLLLQYEPVQAIRMFHALALPAGAALLLVSLYLLKRRRRAWQAAIVLMVALGLFDVLKGLDFEETVITWSVASALVFAGDAFKVRSDPITLRSALWRAPLLSVGGLAVAVLASWASHPDSVQVTAVVTLLAVAYVIFRPLAGPRTLPGPDSRAAVAQIVQDHGTDTLSFFKLRADKHYFFSDERDAFVAYRIENGVLLLSGDPVGAPHAFPGLIEQLKTFAETRGLRLGAVGAHERLCPLYQEFGLKTIYLGDEAIIELDKFSLEGRPIRKVRQSVTRLTKAGYTAQMEEVDRLDAETLAAAEHVLELGREGAPERGFSMAMDRIDGDHAAETLVLLARDEQHNLRGVLHFVPCYGRASVSLSFMRRDPDTPNGLTEFMVCRAVELLRERELEEMSLNFATFARYMHSPETQVERLLGWIAKKFNPYFQIESLYRFNAKFFPRWESRYLVYEGALGLPRAGLAAAWAEGQVWKPARPERPVRQRRSEQLIA